MITISDYKSILCLDGDLPAKKFFATDLPIIAADGAANTLLAMGITPSLVIGDLDGITAENISHVKTISAFNQNFSDFQKCLDYLRLQQLLPAIILGVNGGQIDHILNNINIFLSSKNVFYSPLLYGFSLFEGEIKSFLVPPDTRISIFGLPYARVSSQGLKWELTNYSMRFPGKNSFANRTIASEIRIEIKKGTALVLIYCSQAAFNP